MSEQQNPFKQYLPAKDPPSKDIQGEVMGNIHFKSFLVNILELFSAILGNTMKESIVPQSDNSTEPDQSSKGNS